MRAILNLRMVKVRIRLNQRLWNDRGQKQGNTGQVTERKVGDTMLGDSMAMSHRQSNTRTKMNLVVCKACFCAPGFMHILERITGKLDSSPP